MRLVTTDSAGVGYDLSDRISDLAFSNVDPGGDEVCSFTLHRPWQAANPEIQRGSLCRVLDGVDVLWQGRVEETDRSGGDDETISVTAYGLGARLKDSTVQEIFVDRDLTHWSDGSAQLQYNITMFAAGAFWNWVTSEGATFDKTTGYPCLRLNYSGPTWGAGNGPFTEMQYDANGIAIGSLYYAWKTTTKVFGLTYWSWVAQLTTDDVDSNPTATADLYAAGPGSGTLVAGRSDQDWASVRFYDNDGLAHGTSNQDYSIYWTCLAVVGRHGLVSVGTLSANSGPAFLASQMIANVADRASGITVRDVDATTFAVEQAAFLEPVPIEDAVSQLNQYHSHERTWGTWGPRSPLDFSSDGFFDYVARSESADWIVWREECDALDLHAETATLYNSVKVSYSDASGQQQIVTVSGSVPDLDDAGLTRTAQLDGGTLTSAGAQQLGRRFLELSGGFAPARGSVTVSRQIRSGDGQLFPSYRLRADGSTLRIPDILPSTTTFTLDTTPDRRTTFPIKRVNVDCSGSSPTTTVELDQSNDAISALQARLDLDAQLVG